MFRRSFLALCALALAGCVPAGPAVPATGTTSPASSSPASSVARVGFGALEFERAAYEPLIKAFNAENPDIQVEFVSLEGIFNAGPVESLQAMAGAADTLAPPFFPPEAAETGLFADLRPQIEADPSFASDDFFPGALAQAADGGIYQIPHSLDVQILSYNTDLWDAAGLAAPQPGWSWDDLLAAAEQLARKSGDEVQVYGFDDSQNGALVLQGLLAEAGVALTPGADGSYRLDTPEVAAILDRLASLIERGAIRSRTSEGGLGVTNPFEERAKGQVAMWLGPSFFGAVAAGPGARPAGPAEPDFVTSSAALPILPAQTLLGRRGYAMSAGANDPDAAWRWLAYLSQRQPEAAGGAVRVFGGGTEMPARASQAEAEGFFETQPADLGAALRASLDTYASAPEIDFTVRDALSALANAIAEGTEPGAALAETDGRLQERLAEVAAQRDAPREPVAVQLPEPTAAPDGATPLNFSALGRDPSELRRLAENFNSSGSGHYVQIQPPRIDSEGMSLSRMAQNADCFLWPNPPSADERADLMDLAPLLDADASLDQSDYPPALLQPYRDGAALYGLPLGMNLPVLNYNRDMFDELGLSYPDADWGYAELLEAATRLTQKDGPNPRYGYVATGSQAADLQAFLEWRGAPLTTGSGASLEPNFSDDAVAAAINEYLELLEAASPHTSLGGYRSDTSFSPEPFALTQNGRAGMWYSYGGFGVIIRIVEREGAPEPTIAVAPPPAGPNGPSLSGINSEGMYISAQSANPEGCWEWLKFLSTQPGVLGERFPARSSVANSAEYQAQARPGSAEVYAAYAEALQKPVESGDEIELYWLYQAADRALQGADLERELEQAQATTEAYLACLSAGDAPRTCATSVDPGYAGLLP